MEIYWIEMLEPRVICQHTWKYVWISFGRCTARATCSTAVILIEPLCVSFSISHYTLFFSADNTVFLPVIQTNELLELVL